jgi:mRNA interferase MazF
MRAGLQRGSTWIADLPPPHGIRPVVIVTRDRAIGLLTNVTAVLVTRTVHGAPTEVELGPPEGMRTDCVAGCDNIVTIAKNLLRHRLGELGPEKVRELNGAIRIALDL